MKENCFILFLFLISFSIEAFPQAAKSLQRPEAKSLLAAEDVSGEGNSGVVRASMASYLKETAQLSYSLNSQENRIYFSMKIASMLWELDEEGAKALFGNAIEDLRKLTLVTDSEITDVVNSSDFDFAKLSIRNKLLKKIATIDLLQTGLTKFLLETDALMGRNYFQQLQFSVVNPELQKNLAANQKMLEGGVVYQISGKDLNAAVEIASKRLREQGFFPQAINLLEALYKKDQKKARDFGNEIAQSFKMAGNINEYAAPIQKLLHLAEKNAKYIKRYSSDAKPILDQGTVRYLADLLIRIELQGNRYALLIPKEKVDLLAKFSPQKASEIKKKQDVERARFMELSKAEKALEDEKPRSLSSSIEGKQDAQFIFIAELQESLRPLSNASISPGEKKSIVYNASRRILAVNDKDFVFSMLLWLAVKSAQIGMTEEGGEILREAELLLGPRLKESGDFSSSWKIAQAYVVINPSRSFEITENTLLQLSDVVSAYAVYNEFMAGSSVAEEDEIRLSDPAKQKSLGLRILETYFVKELLSFDVNRAKTLADRISRPEFRVEARLALAQAALSPQKLSEAGIKSDIATKIVEEMIIQKIERE